MPYTIEQLPGEPIILATYTNPLNFAQDFRQARDEIYALSKTIPGSTVYLIHNARDLRVSVNDLYSGIVAVFKPEELKRERDARLHAIGVGAGSVVEFGVDVIKQTRFGGIEIELFETFEEALAYAREGYSPEI
jgi:hypothetical protein